MSYYIVITKYDDGVPIPKMKELKIKCEDANSVSFYDVLWGKMGTVFRIEKNDLKMKRISDTKEGAILLWKEALISEINCRSFALNKLCEALDQCTYFPDADNKYNDEELFDPSI